MTFRPPSSRAVRPPGKRRRRAATSIHMRGFPGRARLSLQAIVSSAILAAAFIGAPATATAATYDNTNQAQRRAATGRMPLKPGVATTSGAAD